VSESSGINQAFLGLIVLPIAGNAAEHITAVFVAVKNKMDLAIAVALGSSIQIAVFLIPVVVLTGWAMGRDFTLDFDAFAVLMLTGGWVGGVWGEGPVGVGGWVGGEGGKGGQPAGAFGCGCGVGVAVGVCVWRGKGPVGVCVWWEGGDGCCQGLE
jgi:hypothetical protein